MTESLQDRYAPRSICFGCGPANEKGLHIKSRVEGDEVVADWMPSPEHHAFDDMLNGGIAGALLDCHCNWAATWHLMQKHGLASPPCTVTAEYSLRFRRPTPMSTPVRLVARVVESGEDRATVEGAIESKGEKTVLFRGTFVAVKEGHPAFHRW